MLGKSNMNVGAKTQINKILSRTNLNSQAKIHRLQAIINSLQKFTYEGKPYNNNVITNLTQNITSKIKNLELNLFLKNLKNGKNIPSDKILNYSKMLGYSANTLNSLHKEVSTNKNLKRNNQTQIKNALGGLIAQKLSNNSIQKKRNEIVNRYKLVQKHNLSKFSFFLGAFLRFFISFLLIFIKNYKFIFRSFGNFIGILNCILIGLLRIPIISRYK